MKGDRDKKFHIRKPRKEQMTEGMRFRFKKDRRENNRFIQETFQEFQWERCVTSDMRAFSGGMGHQIAGGIGHQVHEHSWGAWLVHID